MKEKTKKIVRSILTRNLQPLVKSFCVCYLAALSTDWTCQHQPALEQKREQGACTVSGAHRACTVQLSWAASVAKKNLCSSSGATESLD